LKHKYMQSTLKVKLITDNDGKVNLG